MNRRPGFGAAGALCLWLAAAACSPNLFETAKAPEITGLTLDHYQVDPGDTVTATVSVKDAKDQNLHYDWTATGGQFLPPLDAARVLWKAAAAGGTYRLTVTVSNGEKSSSRSQDVNVRSFALPDVKILSPEADAHFVQYSTLSVTARARHDNGISKVDLFLNNTRKATVNGRADGQYSFTCPLDEPSGQAYVKIEAVANITGKAGRDSVRIFIEGTVPGKALGQ